MSISKTNSKLKKIGIMYLYISILCLIFSLTYEYCSHGVYSMYMLGMALLPFFLGALPFAFLNSNDNLKSPSKLNIIAWNCGVATLTAGSCMKGIIEIYGTTSSLIKYYFIVGVIWIIFSILMYAVNLFIEDKKIII